jgi:hypothetical protein
MLMTIAAVIAVLWLLGLITGIGGSLINLLLVVAVAVLLYDLFVNRRHSHV